MLAKYASLKSSRSTVERKLKNDIFSDVLSDCRQKTEILHFYVILSRAGKICAKSACRTCSTITRPHSTNHMRINDLLRRHCTSFSIAISSLLATEKAERYIYQKAYFM